MNDADRKTSSAPVNTEAEWDQYINEPAPSPPEEKERGRPAGEPFKPSRHQPSKGSGKAASPKDIPDAEIIDSTSEEIIDPLFLKLEDMQTQLQKLSADFQSKLKYDEHKNRLIDDLHQELQTHKDDIVKRFLRSMMMDLIQFIDSIRKLTDFYATQEPDRIDSNKLLQLLNNIPSDLEDICGRQGVLPFFCDGGAFDPSRQRVLKQVETDDPSLDKRVAESLRPGYEWDDQMIRPEMVAVYTYKKPPEPQEPSREEAVSGTSPLEENEPIQPDEPHEPTPSSDILKEPEEVPPSAPSNDTPGETEETASATEEFSLPGPTAPTETDQIQVETQPAPEETDEPPLKTDTADEAPAETGTPLETDARKFDE
ncbi:MAG: nucleotide exchange factor GrpE [Thermodesulfobacteriota bacterium]